MMQVVLYCTPVCLPNSLLPLNTEYSPMWLLVLAV